MIKHTAALILIVGLAASPAFATTYEGTCTTAPESQWISETDAKGKLAEAGYSVSKFKRTRTGNCYEAYVTDQNGKRMELFLDPTNAKIVHSQ